MFVFLLVVVVVE